MVMSPNKGRLFAIATSIVFIGIASIAFSQMPPTNEQILVEAVANSINLPENPQTDSSVFQLKISDALKILGLDSSGFQLKSTDGLNSLAAEGLRLHYSKTKQPLKENFNSAGDSSYIINVSLSALQLIYSKGSSRGFLRKPHVRRTLTGQILVNVNGKGYNYGGFHDIKYSDEIEYNQANYVASLRYKELTAQLPSLGASKYLEPLAVAATVGGLIYLFFVNR
jgi:hypothetical protein